MNSRVNYPPAAIISLNAAAGADENVALCGLVPLPDGDASWVHLLPHGTITTKDGRGPWRIDDMAALIAKSLPAGERLVLDVNHATDLAAPAGLPAPAVGWIVALESRTDGLWGQVEWTDEGKSLVARKAYRGISPAIAHDKAGKVIAFLRASLTNLPNIKNLKTLHQESGMNPLLKKLAAALGLDESTSEETLIAAVTTLHQAQSANATALNSIGAAAGIKAGATLNAETIVAAIQQLAAASGKDEQITSLQSEIATLTTSLNTERETRLKKEATTFVDAAIAEGRTGVKPLRDHYITRHMADPVAVAKEIAAMPKLVGGSVVPQTPANEGGVSLNAEEASVIAQMGLTSKQFSEARGDRAAA